jgi:hypothetical protein
MSLSRLDPFNQNLQDFITFGLHRERAYLKISHCCCIGLCEADVVMSS